MKKLECIHQPGFDLLDLEPGDVFAIANEAVYEVDNPTTDEFRVPYTHVDVYTFIARLPNGAILALKVVEDKARKVFENKACVIDPVDINSDMIIGLPNWVRKFVGGAENSCCA